MAVAAIAAAQNAHREKEFCILYVEGFEHNKASVQEVQTYAECVERLYPQPASEDAVFAGKVCVTLIFIAMIVGFIHGWKVSGFGEGIWYSLVWVICCIATILFWVLVLAGIGFLLS